MLAPPDEMGRRAWAWIVRREAEFFTPGDDDAAARRRAKCVAELAFIAGTLTDAPHARRLLDRAWDELGRGDGIARLLATWPVAATSYLPFRLAGYRSPALDGRLAERAWLDGHPGWPPFVRFAIGATLESIGVPRPWDDRQVVLANRFFAPPTRETTPRAAFLAHAILWRSEMGRYPAGLSADATRLYRSVSPGWHAVLGEAGFIDPLGEIIAADICAGCEPPAASLALMAAVQREDGAVPAFVRDEAVAFDDIYHSTCVAALAGGLAGKAIGVHT